MPRRLLREWQAFDQIEPIGARDDDLRTAYTLATLGNIVGGGKYVGPEKSDKHRAAYTVEDFLFTRVAMPARRQKPETPRVGPSQLAAVMASLGAQMPPAGMTTRNGRG